jgi:hypothetical protein
VEFLGFLAGFLADCRFLVCGADENDVGGREKSVGGVREQV